MSWDSCHTNARGKDAVARLSEKGAKLAPGPARETKETDSHWAGFVNADNYFEDALVIA